MMTTHQWKMSRLTAVTIFNRSIVLLKEDLHNLLVFALFEDVLFSCSEIDVHNIHVKLELKTKARSSELSYKHKSADKTVVL